MINNPIPYITKLAEFNSVFIKQVFIGLFPKTPKNNAKSVTTKDNMNPVIK